MGLRRSGDRHNGVRRFCKRINDERAKGLKRGTLTTNKLIMELPHRDRNIQRKHDAPKGDVSLMEIRMLQNDIKCSLSVPSLILTNVKVKPRHAKCETFSITDAIDDYKIHQQILNIHDNEEMIF